jgi:cystathionine beta-lyase/cystathionine gamma-synthase
MDPQERSDRSQRTQAIHAGRDPAYSSMPIYMASTGRSHYTRGGNPTIDALEASVATLEGGAHATATACGMSAVTQALLTLLKSGDRVVCHRSVYDWTDTFLLQEVRKFGIQTVQVDMRDTRALERALEHPTSVLYLEPLSNPGLDVIDVGKVARMGHEAGAVVVADNTFLSPALLRPLEHGADVVIHSATKYLCGHSDALGGIVISDDTAFIEKLRTARNVYGGVISPFNAFLILRGIGTLPVRIAQHCANAQRIAEFLAQHPAIAETRYPGLPSDPGHETAKATFAGSGGMVGFVIAGGQAAADVFRDAVKLCRPWVSLGDVGTLLYCRWPEPRKGIPEGFVRMSVGLEHADDIIADLDQALDEAHRASG